MNTARDRQRAYRQRRRSQGHKAITVWLDSDAYAILERQARAYAGDRSDRQAAVIGNALRALDAVTSHSPGVTGSVTSHITRHRSRNAPSTARRYLPHELEDHMLALRESGLSVRETARRLADEGCLNSKRRPYSSSTIKNAADRAKARRDNCLR